MKKRIWAVLFLLAVVINIIAWQSSSFCDFYVRSVFPAVSGLYGRLTSALPFSLGEWMIVFAVFFCALLLASGILRLLVRKQWARTFFSYMGRAFCWIGLAFFWIMTCNCFILYHASAFEETYMEQVREDGYTVQELGILRDYIVVNLNELSGKMPRDEEGYLLYEGDMNRAAIAAMQRMGENYDQLLGYYPQPKEIYFSDLLSQSYMMGYYFPFSMEANYNRTMYVVNKPSVICHELAHLKGFIQEDEANLIGYLACIASEDAFFRYSGYMSVLSYVEREFRASINNSASAYQKHPAISQQVYDDSVFLTKEAWQEVEKKAVVSTGTVKRLSNAATEATLKLNGVEEGMKSYEGVVKLLLDYYDGILYGDVLMQVDAEPME